MSGFDQGTISKWETLKAPMDAHHVRRLAKAYALTVEAVRAEPPLTQDEEDESRRRSRREPDTPLAEGSNAPTKERRMKLDSFANVLREKLSWVPEDQQYSALKEMEALLERYIDPDAGRQVKASP